MNELEQALAFLTAEVEREFLGLFEQIRHGPKTVIVRHRSLCRRPTPECLRRIGALTVLCAYYGCTVVFANDRQVDVVAETV